MPTTPWYPANGPGEGPAGGVSSHPQAAHPAAEGGPTPPDTPHSAPTPDHGRRSAGVTGPGSSLGRPRRSALTPGEPDDTDEADDGGAGVSSAGRRANAGPWRDAPVVAPRRSAVSAMSASSPASGASAPASSPGASSGASPATGERSLFARPLPGEEEAPTVVLSTRRLVEHEPGPRPPAAGPEPVLEPEPVEPPPEPRPSPSEAARDARTIRLPGRIRPTGRRGVTAPRATFALAGVRTLVLGAAAVLALLLVVGGGTYLLTRPGSPIAITVSEKPLALPVRAGEFTREAGKVPSVQAHSDGRTTITASYERAGKGQFVVVASRPERDATSALTAASAVGVQTAPGGACGRIGQQTACAVMASRTTALVGVTQVDQSKDELIVALRRVAEAMG